MPQQSDALARLLPAFLFLLPLGVALDSGCKPRFKFYEGVLDSGLVDTNIDDTDHTGGGDDTGSEDSEDTQDSEDTEHTGDDDYWSEASLVILSPSSGDFLPLGEDARFEAAVLDAEGDTIEYEEITWSSDQDSSWDPIGATFDDDSLDAGSHTITARAELPNGDRLAYAVGDVLVQSEYAGLYTGTLTISGIVTISGTAVPVSASGGATLIIDPTGETVTGDAEAVIVFYGYELAMNYTFNGENDDGEIEGTAGLELGSWYTIDLDMEGNVTTDGLMELSFEAALDIDFYITFSLEMDGSVDATRVSRDTELSTIW